MTKPRPPLIGLREAEVAVAAGRAVLAGQITLSDAQRRVPQKWAQLGRGLGVAG